MKRSRSSQIFALGLIAILFAGAALAQQPMQFKVGDRVEIDVIMAGAPERSMYKKGTVVAVDEKDKAYVVDVDPFPGKLPQHYRIPVRDYGKYWIRAATGGGAANTAPVVATDKLRVDDNGTVLADREILDCEHLTHTGRNGSPLPSDLARKLIRCTIERPSQPGMDGAQIMDITEFTPGAARRWKLYEDMGQGSLNTLVYPVHVKWNQKTFYRTRNVAVTDKEGMFTCFVDNTNLWQCGSAAGPRKDGTTQEIRVTK
jgi:hypothetical protein